MTIQKEWLYDRCNDCVICKDRRGCHAEECPGNIIDGMKVEISYEAYSIPDHSDESAFGEFVGDTVDQTARDLAEHAVQHGMKGVQGRARYIFDLGDVTPAIDKAHEAIRDEVRQKQLEWERLQTLRVDWNRRERMLQELEELRPDLVPDAYTRRREAILGQFPQLGDEKP